MTETRKPGVSLHDHIMGYDDITSDTVTVPQWGDVVVEVRSISLDERNIIVKQSRNKKGDTDLGKYYPRLVVATCFDPETGERLFTMQDIPGLERKSSAALDRITKLAAKLAGVLDDEDEENEDDDEAEFASAAQKGVDAAGKDSSSTQIFGSGSSSLSDSDTR